MSDDWDDEDENIDWWVPPALQGGSSTLETAPQPAKWRSRPVPLCRAVLERLERSALEQAKRDGGGPAAGTASATVPAPLEAQPAGAGESQHQPPPAMAAPMTLRALMMQPRQQQQQQPGHSQPSQQQRPAPPAPVAGLGADLPPRQAQVLPPGGRPPPPAAAGGAPPGSHQHYSAQAAELRRRIREFQAVFNSLPPLPPKASV